MKVQIEEQKTLVRDTKSKAITSMDTMGYLNFKTKKEKQKKTEARLDALETSMKNIEKMLETILKEL